jgi:hypothetical protein
MLIVTIVANSRLDVCADQHGVGAVLVWLEPNNPPFRHSHASDCTHCVMSGSVTAGNVRSSDVARANGIGRTGGQSVPVHHQPFEESAL